MENESYIYSEQTNKIIGLCYKVYNKLGYGHLEKIYQKALATEFDKNQVVFRREVFGKIKYDGEVIGRYYLDFLIDDKIALEIKVRREIYESDWMQLLNYLKSKNLKLGLLIVFSKGKVKIKRVINSV